MYLDRIKAEGRQLKKQVLKETERTPVLLKDALYRMGLFNDFMWNNADALLDDMAAHTYIDGKKYWIGETDKIGDNGEVLYSLLDTDTLRAKKQETE